MSLEPREAVGDLSFVLGQKIGMMLSLLLSS